MAFSKEEEKSSRPKRRKSKLEFSPPLGNISFIQLAFTENDDFYIFRHSHDVSSTFPCPSHGAKMTKMSRHSITIFGKVANLFPFSRIKSHEFSSKSERFIDLGYHFLHFREFFVAVDDGRQQGRRFDPLGVARATRGVAIIHAMHRLHPGHATRDLSKRI